MTSDYTNDPALLEWCESLLVKGDFDAAEGFAKILYETKEHSALLMLARAMDANGNSKKATELLSSKIKKIMGTVGPEMFELAQLNGKTLAAMGQLKPAEKNLKHALRVLPRDESFAAVRERTEYQLGSLLAALGKPHAAQKIFNKAMPVNCDNNWKTSARVVDFFADTDATKKLKNAKIGNSKFSIDAKISTDAELIYLVSGDFNYCRQFAPALTKSLNDVADKRVHLHIHGISIGPSDAAIRESAWTRLLQDLKTHHSDLSFSHRHLNVEDINSAQTKSIYSFERFRILPSVLSTYNLPVLVADIDQLPLRNPIDLLDQKFDVALLKFPKGVLNILSVISATLSLYRPSPEGKIFAQGLCDYFTCALDNDAKLNWHVDQAGLAVMDYQNNVAGILYLNPKLVVTNPKKHDPVEAAEKGAWFWSVTNSIQGNAGELKAFTNGSNS